MNTCHSDDILDTIESFLDTCPALEDNDDHPIFGTRSTGENEGVRMQEVTLDGVRYLIVVKRIDAIKLTGRFREFDSSSDEIAEALFGPKRENIGFTGESVDNPPTAEGYALIEQLMKETRV